MKSSSFAALALLAQGIPPAGLWILAMACYGPERWIPEVSEEEVSLAWLAVSTALSWGFAGRASFRLLTENRPPTALPLIAVCCAPGWVAGAFYFHSIFVFAGLL